MTALTTITERELEAATLRFLGKPEDFHAKLPAAKKADWIAGRRMTFSEWKDHLRTTLADLGVQIVDDAAPWIDPEWAKAGKVHDWRNHVDEKVQAIWHTFTAHQRKVLYEDADGRADAEEWD